MSGLIRVIVNLSHHNSMRSGGGAAAAVMEVMLPPTATIGDLKRAIYARDHTIWPEYQWIFHNYRVIPDGRTLDVCGIRDGTTVDMDYQLRFDEVVRG